MSDSTQVIASTNPFVNLGKSFQEKMLQALIMDKRWAADFIEIFNVDECLESKALKLIANKYINSYKDFKEFPSTDLLVTMIKDSLIADQDIVIRQQCFNFLKRIIENQDLGDLPWVKEKAFTFCKQQVLVKALNKSVEIILTDKYETVIDIMKEAITSGTPSSTGHDYNNDIDARYSNTYRNCVPTGIPELDERKILNGGLGAGEIGIIVAPTGVGKSHLLVDFSSYAITQGKNVFYYTFELKEQLIGVRFDSNLLDMPSSECYDCTTDIKKYFEKHNGTLGRLIIKEYPARKMTCINLLSHIEHQMLKGIKPDMIAVDYAGLMRSTERSELLRMEMQLVIQDLRNLARELDIPLWTALQSNKEGAKSEIVDVTNMAESYGQASEADFVLGLQRLSTQKSTGYGNIFVAKNRAGIDGIGFKIHLDTAKSKLRILTQSEVEESMAESAVTAEKLQIDTLNSFREEVQKSKKRYENIR